MTRSRGFTLVEILVALALLALVAVLAYRGVASLVDGETRLADEAQRWRALDAALARMEADIRQAIPRAVDAGTTREPAWIAALESHGASAIAFSRAGAEFDAEPGIAGQRIGYRLRSGTLEVVYWPGLDRARAGDAGAQAWPLVDGVAQLRIDHLGERGAWLPSWPQPGEGALPRALRVTLTLASGEAVERWFALR
jgi:general secretion pathway protein J